MNNFSNQFPLTGFLPKENPALDYRSAGYIKEQSVTAQESLDTELVIETKEGDRVTLSSNSFSHMDAYTYDSKGMVQSQNGSAAYSEQYQEITLASGQSFSFTVEGDLSKDELKDLSKMLKGIDKIISEVTSGDMDGAMNKASKLTGYDSFSAYSVDISYEAYYEMSSSEAAMVSEKQVADRPQEELEATAPAVPQIPDFDSFFDKIMNQVDELEDNLFSAAKQPLNQLFNHHLDEIENDDDAPASLADIVEKAMNQVNSFMDEVMGELVDGQELEMDDD